MIGQNVTITKVDHEGRALISYPGEIVYADERCVVARCAWGHDHVVDLGPFCLERGDIFVEFYYWAESFNVFVIYDVTGRIKGWYCNVTEQVEIDRDIRWRDLALDLLVLPDGRQLVLDEDEFEALKPSLVVRSRAYAAIDALKAMVHRREPPFADVLFMDC